MSLENQKGVSEEILATKEAQYVKEIYRQVENKEPIFLEKILADIEAQNLNKDNVAILMVALGYLEPLKNKVTEEEFVKRLYGGI